MKATQHRRTWLPITVTGVLAAVVGLVVVVTMGSAPRHDAQATSAPTTANQSSAASPSSTSPATGAGTGTIATPATATSPPTTTQHSSATAHTPATSRSSSPAAAAQAGRIKPGVTYHGVATEYSAADGDGACLFGPSSDMMIAAMNEADYENSQACGAHILVHAANGATVTVLITNECPYPCAPGQLDLSQQAFAKIADPVAGRVPITWQLISPGTSGSISVRYKTGSSQYWCGIQVIGARNPVVRLEVQAGSGWQQLPRASYNYFLSANGAGCGKSIRITDIFGQQLTATGLAVKPNVVQPAGIQFAQH